VLVVGGILISIRKIQRHQEQVKLAAAIG